MAIRERRWSDIEFGGEAIWNHVKLRPAKELPNGAGLGRRSRVKCCEPIVEEWFEHLHQHAQFAFQHLRIKGAVRRQHCWRARKNMLCDDVLNEETDMNVKNIGLVFSEHSARALWDHACR